VQVDDSHIEFRISHECTRAEDVAGNETAKSHERERQKKFIATCGKDVIHCICECSKNLLKGNLPQKQHQLKSLSLHKHWLRELALKKTTLSK
jgi:hypothetical protein